MAQKFEQYIHEAIRSELITGAAVSAIDRDGNFLLNKAFGKSDVGADAKDFAMDTTFWIASSTKLLTSIALLQLVEAGKVQPEASVTEILPEWKDAQILLGFDDDGKPKLKPATKPLTLTHLLTHSSGIGYDMMNPTLVQYRQFLGMGPPSNDTQISDSWPNVLLFEPGEGWEYGCGIDWAGLLLERITGLTLGEYLKVNIFERLGIHEAVFDPLPVPSMMEKMHGRVIRGRDGKVARYNGDQFAVVPKAYDGGGSGLYSSTAEYIKVLRSILKQDEKLLKQGTVDKYMLQGQLEPQAQQALNAKLRTPEWGSVGAIGFPWFEDNGIVFSHGLASALVLTKIDGLCGNQTMYWGGLPNNSWYIDWDRGVAAHYGTWLVPPGDQTTSKVFTELKKAMYLEVGKQPSPSL